MELHLGDCLGVMQRIPDNFIDLVLCDLPYEVTQCSWDTIIPFDSLWAEYNRVVKPNGVIALFAAQPFTSKLVCSNLEQYRYQWVWDCVCTSGFLNANKRPLKQHETVEIFSKATLGNHTYNPQFIEGKERILTTGTPNATDNYGKANKIVRKSNKRFPKTILSFTNPNGKGKFHPTQKPISILEYLVKTYSNPGDVVLDNCMGSGSTGVACVNTQRYFIGIEKDIKYFEIAEARIKGAQEEVLCKNNTMKSSNAL
jgi:DNA modification methylase